MIVHETAIHQNDSKFKLLQAPLHQSPYHNGKRKSHQNKKCKTIEVILISSPWGMHPIGTVSIGNAHMI